MPTPVWGEIKINPAVTRFYDFFNLRRPSMLFTLSRGDAEIKTCCEVVNLRNTHVVNVLNPFYCTSKYTWMDISPEIEFLTAGRRRRDITFPTLLKEALRKR